MSNIGFTSLLHTLTVNSKDDGERFTDFTRVDAIKSLLADSDYQLVKEGKLFLLYAKGPIAGKEIVLISSHIDCVYDRCFCEEVDEEHFKGTFDNSLTNAAVIFNMRYGLFDDNVVVAFTGDEEKDSGGCLELIGHLINQSECKVRFALVTDVTNEGWEAECPFSIENDLGIDLFTAHHIVETLAPFQYNFVHDAEPDESWDYDGVGMPCLTLCVPVAGDMHSDEGTLVRKKGLPTYCQALRLLANSLASDNAEL